jgi:hypothetical protein
LWPRRTSASHAFVKRSAGPTAGEPVRLRPADPFDLIRWLARSQGDPRKAVAELVQNSLDANARRVVVERKRIGSAPAIVVSDDGDGVLPDLSREEALRHLAQHIGHSRKAKLTAAERRDRVIAGKYGVGLLGFWAIGHRMELRSRVGGGRVLALCLVEDEPGGRIIESAPRIDMPATFTEVVVLDVHETALRSLTGARLASYLGSELRGQLLARDVELVVRDGMARGTAQKRFDVRPKRFLGEKLDVPASIDVPHHAPLSVELYYVRGEPDAAVQIACAGTVVCESVRELAGLDVDAEPWMAREVVGVLDFPDLNVPPGTRRGIIPDAAAHAFVAALAELRPYVMRELDRFARERDRVAQRDLAKELRRALRGFGQRLPQYELPIVSEPSREGALALSARGAEAAKDRGGDAGEPSTADDFPPGVGVADAAEEAPTDDEESFQLFAPGDLESVRIVPDPIVLRPGRERRVRADARDEDGRIIRRALAFAWHVDGTEDVEVHGEGPRPALVALPSARVGKVAGTLHVTVEEPSSGRSAAASATMVVDDADDVHAFQDGIPEPLFESDARGMWRSRFDGARWIVNDAHEDWIALRVDGKARLRYILSLFAKDVALRSFGVPGASDVLERMVEILAHAERNLRGGG